MSPDFVTPSLSRGLYLFAFLILFSVTTSAAEFANVEYLCCAWGPAMTLPTKAGEKPEFSDTEEEVYFLKQVGRFSRGPLGEQGQGINVYLCKMKADGSAKTEIRELWHDVRYPIDTQAQSCWMDVNVKTKKIALSVTYAGSDLTGLWTLGLDGADLMRIIAPVQNEKGLQSINSPSWTPDGGFIVFEELIRGTRPIQSSIAICDGSGANFKRLLVPTNDTHYSQPRISPDGTLIAYIAIGDTNGGLSLMNLDGSQPHRVPNPDSRRNTHGCTYPTWNPDGKAICGISMGVVDASTGRTISEREPELQGRRSTCGWSHWGRLGFVGFNVGGIKFTDSELREDKWIGSSKLVECSGGKESCRW